MEKIYQLVVHGLVGEKMCINLCNTEEQFKTITVGQLKEKILSMFPYGLENIRLAFNHKVLDGDSTLLCDYGIRHKSRIFMFLKLSGGGGGFPEKGDGGLGDKDKSENLNMV